MGLREYDDGSEIGDAGKAKKFFEFDCPTCNANNPYPDGFVARDEIRCYYCGTEFRVKITEEGKLKLKEM